MHLIDLFIFGIYIVNMLGIRGWYMRKNSTAEYYFVAGINLKSLEAKNSLLRLHYRVVHVFGIAVAANVFVGFMGQRSEIDKHI